MNWFSNYHDEFHNKATNSNYLIVFDNINLRLNYVQRRRRGSQCNHLLLHIKVSLLFEEL
jgi:hypothetical protein